ncbi:MAG: LysR family transcriptional regulator [Bacteroidales bacterium]|nr:LysR family transcriptional regulator [Bacteroidales bacterium]
MTDNRLKVFCTVADTLSFSKAALILGISQPAVSKNIAALEEELGGALFLRINKTLILTDKGKQLLTIASAILEEYSKIDSIRE